MENLERIQDSGFGIQESGFGNQARTVALSRRSTSMPAHGDRNGPRLSLYRQNRNLAKGAGTTAQAVQFDE
jgi:hypothetical protein